MAADRKDSKEDVEAYKAMVVQREAEVRVLFPPRFDFSKVCSCNECSAKIKVLKEFEANLRSRDALVQDLVDKVARDQDTIVHVFTAVERMVWLWDILNGNLQGLDETGGGILEIKRSKSEDDMRKMYSEFAAKLMDYELLSEPEFIDARNPGAEYADTHSLKLEMEAALHFINKSKSKGVVHNILHKIEAIEQNHEREQRNAEEQERPFDISISKMHIVNQINCLEELPVGEIHRECQEVLQSLDPKLVNSIYGAHDKIDKTYKKMIGIRRQFWKRYERTVSLASNKDQEKHSWSGLEKTLFSLGQQAERFNKWWKTFEQHVTLCQGSDPKSLKTSPP
ncbi:unnamed protein product [Cuscuta epithymum]|uniref:Uncharacterized protein n=1 Tax=Cuscuta epithymum TaxID=186058 RepID=A0AAV0DPG5_9ASTE|nr:unnamed protein product [Cuscuta epithymum]